jgi:hypothetical protein
VLNLYDKNFAQVHPKKTMAIKAEVEKLVEVWFYLSCPLDRMGF